MLDRGQIKDWFSSSEIWIEGTIGAVALYLFVVHMLTTTGPRFVSPQLFKDRNFLTGNVFIFVVGVVLFATLALLPPLLQDLLNYPGGNHGTGDGTARHRHAAGHVCRRPFVRKNRLSHRDRLWLRFDGAVLLANDPFRFTNGSKHRGLVRYRARAWVRASSMCRWLPPPLPP